MAVFVTKRIIRKVFANVGAAASWFEDDGPESVAFEYSVQGASCPFLLVAVEFRFDRI
jgi:streptomycin 6-kinase